MQRIALPTTSDSVAPKGGHQRTLPVTDAVAHHLDAYLRDRPAGAGPLLRSTTNPTHGLTARWVGVLIAQWMTDAGVKTMPRDGRSAHAFRHSFAQRFYRTGGDPDLRLVQTALGHRCLSSTETYMRAHVDIVRLRAALDHMVTRTA